MAKQVRPSPLLGAVSSMISAETERMVSASAKFRHSFEVDVAQCAPDPDQARRVFHEAEIAQLAATMEEQGQLQPILVRRHGSDARAIWHIVAWANGAGGRRS